MKSSTVHAILSEVYRLLGDYNEAEFIQASEYKGITVQLREALRSLAREARGLPGQASEPPISRRQSSPSSVEAVGSQKDRLNEMSAIVDLISRSKRLNSNPSMIQFAREFGLKVSPRPKESRERLARRVATAISLTPEPRRAQILTQIAGSGDEQTQGWIDVIKGPRS